MDVSDIFKFFCSGEGTGLRGARKRVREVGFLLKIPGFFCQDRGGGGLRGRGGCLGGILRGGAKYLFSGPKFPPRGL